MLEKSLRQIALECVGDIVGIGDIRTDCFEVKLLRYAEKYGVSFVELLNAANQINLNNEENRFERAVINPIKRVQGIYY